MARYLDRTFPLVLSLFRIVIGLLFFVHGLKSLFGVLDGVDGHGETISATLWPGGYAADIQLAVGALLLVGLGTRLAAFIGSGSMAYAYFHVHLPHGLWPAVNGGEPAALFCWALFLLVFSGGGVLALDRLLARRKSA